MIDRTLNYGRHHIRRFLANCGKFDLVVDLGAGRGDDLLAARAVNPRAALHAIEPSTPLASQLRQLGAVVHDLDVERSPLPFQDQTVDVVIANQLLEHTKEIFWIFHEISRVLRPSGNVILGLPNLASFHNRVLLVAGRQPTCVQLASAHVRAFTRPGLLYFLDQGFPGGYKLEDFGGSNFYPFPPLLARRLAHWLPTLAWGIFFRFRKRLRYERSFLDYPRAQKLETNFFLGHEEPTLTD